MATESRKFGPLYKEMCAHEGLYTLRKIGDALGVKAQSVVRFVSADANPTVSRAIEYLAAVDCTLAVVPKDIELPEGCTRLVPAVDAHRGPGKQDEN